MIIYREKSPVKFSRHSSPTTRVGGFLPPCCKKLRKNIVAVADRYDIDFELSKVKERIENYKDPFKGMIISELGRLLNFDILTHSFRDEIIKSTEWLLKESMPGVTNQQYQDKGQSHNLGEYRDFNDDLWYAAIYADKLKWIDEDGRPFKVSLADEVQDFNKCQKIALEKLGQTKSRVVAVGDPNQCVIEGTLILKDGKYVPVESLSIEDEIDCGMGEEKITKSKITDIFSKNVNGIDVIRIKTKTGKEVVTTTDHTHFAGYIKESHMLHFTYLMYREDLGFRIGVTRSRRSFYNFGANARLNCERADCLWLLGSFDTEKEARFYEQYYSVKYSLPTWLFNAANTIYDQNDVINLFSSIETRKNGLKLLNDKNMFFEHPHIRPKCMNKKRYRNFNILMCGDPRYKGMHKFSLSGSYDSISNVLPNVTIRKSKNSWRCEGSRSNLADIYNLAEFANEKINAIIIEKARLSKKSLPYCPASHVLPGMSIFVESEGKIILDEVESVSTETYSGKIYDLNVDRLHNFIANGIATHNSLYRFRGADSKSFDKLSKSLQDTKNHGLSLNFRSKPAIIDFVNNNTKVKNLKTGIRVNEDALHEFIGNYQTIEGGPEYMEKLQEILGGTIEVEPWKEAINENKIGWPPNANGKVSFEEQDYEDIFNSLAKERQETGKIRQTAFISRTNAPLVHSALRLLSSSVPFVITGKDIAQDLQNHIDQVLKARIKHAPHLNGLVDDSPVMDLEEKINEFFESNKQSHGHKAAKQSELKELQEITKALSACIDQFDPNVHSPTEPEIDPNDHDQMEGLNQQGPSQGNEQQPKTIGNFKKWLTSKLQGLDLERSAKDVKEYMNIVEDNKDNSPVVLTTSHLSKGLEFDRVYVLRNDQFPHPMAVLEEDLEQEENAKYVTYTRAMDELHVVKTEGQPGVKSKNDNSGWKMQNNLS